MATKLKQGASGVVNESGIEIKTVYSPDDLENGHGAGEDRIGKPGEYPFTRGIHAEMYRRRPWTMRQYISAWIPRVNGYSPGLPMRSSSAATFRRRITRP